MILAKGLCKVCNKITYLENKKYGLCPVHNRARLQADNPKKKQPIRLAPKREATGEAALFKAIWFSRPHYCTNCNEFLGHEAKSWFFSHIKSKGAYPELRLDPANIQLLCLTCHNLYDQGTREAYNNRKA
jgi:5-methylcytosine-specific restriction endonuclease McrA